MKGKAKQSRKRNLLDPVVMAVAAITDTPIPRGEDLLGSAELKKKFLQAKRSLRAKPRGK